MKTFVLFIAGILFATIGFSQETQDVIYLKNDSIIKGIIIEQVPNEHIKIKTNDGSAFVYKFSEIEKMTKETEDIILDEYGGEFSYGVAVGLGGGLVGVPIRIYPSPLLAFELGAYFRPFIVAGTGGDSYYGLLLAGGPIFYLSKNYNSTKQKIHLDGISVKGGYTFSEVSNGILAVNWVHETFKKKNKKRSFIFELGAGIVIYGPYSTTEYDSGYNTFTIKETTYDGGVGPLVYFQCHWNWYKK